jgi:hypothetical protein
VGRNKIDMTKGNKKVGTKYGKHVKVGEIH